MRPDPKATLLALLGAALVLGAAAATARAQQATGAQAPATQTVAEQNKPCADDWVQKIRQPIPQLKVGADARLRWEYQNNVLTLNGDSPGHEMDYQRYRTRLWGTLTPADWMAANARLTWEGRHWIQLDKPDDWDESYVLFDQLNVVLTGKEPPVSLIVGRQDIILGDGWLVIEGTPLDGSRTAYFDAIRSIVELKQINTIANLIYIQQYANADRTLSVIGTDSPANVIEQNEKGVIVYLTNRSVKRTVIDPYFIYKHDQRVQSNGDQGEIYTPGIRVAHEFSEHLVGRSELAYQTGRKNGSDLSAWGLNNRLTYAFKDEIKNELYVDYEMLTGDDPGTSTSEQFDPLWGRWTRWTDLVVTTYTNETHYADITNLHRVGIGWQAQPRTPLTLAAAYYALFADQNPLGETTAGGLSFSDDGKFRGHLFQTSARYTFNRHLMTRLVGECLLPGNYYASPSDDIATFVRGEIVITF